MERVRRLCSNSHPRPQFSSLKCSSHPHLLVDVKGGFPVFNASAIQSSCSCTSFSILPASTGHTASAPCILLSHHILGSIFTRQFKVCSMSCGVPRLRSQMASRWLLG